jgi:hypothetical protein
MKVTFEFTLEELVEAHLRFSKRSKTVRAWQRRDLIYVSGISGVVAYFIFFIKGPWVALIFAVISSVVAGVLYPTLHEATIKKRLRKLADEKRDAIGPLLCEVELTETGVVVKQGNTVSTYLWDQFEAIDVTGGSVDMFTADGAGVIVRSRAFKSADEKTALLTLQIHTSRSIGRRTTNEQIRHQASL